MTANGVHDATGDRAQLREWWGRWPHANLGIATGPFVVVDVDPRHGGDDTLRDLEREHGELPRTVQCLTGGGGAHYYFQPPDGAVKNGPIAGGVDFKCAGGYVVAPPSLHASGRRYMWEGASDPADTPVAPCPPWIAALASPKAHAEHAAHAPGSAIAKGQRNAALASIAGAMRRRGLNAPEIAAALLEVNTRRCEPPLPAWEVQTIAASIASYPAACPVAGESDLLDGSPLELPLTDAGNSRRLVRTLGDDLRYCDAWHKWLAWDGTRFAFEDTGQSMRAARAAVHLMEAEAMAAGPARAAEVRRHALRSQSAERLSAMLRLAQSEREIAVHARAFDRDPMLFNCVNGTLHLRSGVFREHRRADLLSKRAGCEYRPGARCDTWLRFLGTVMRGDAPMLAFLQRIAGYLLTGRTTEQVMFLAVGRGRNGKTTFVQALAALLGDYALRTPSEMFAVKQFDGIPNDVARLQGARFAYASEIEQGRQIAEARIKDLTGGDTVTARFLHGEYFEFEPVCKLWLSANHRPRIAGTDEGIWRRIVEIGFDYVVPAGEVDPDLRGKLHDELPGILNWALEGCRLWQETGLAIPAGVREAVDAHRAGCDALHGFFAQRCVMEASGEAGATVLYRAYVQWCAKEEVEAMSQQKFGRRMNAAGFGRRRGGDGYRWRGVSLKECTL